MHALQTYDLRSFDGTRLTVFDGGNPDGPTIMLVNGLGGNVTSWRHAIADLSLDFRIVTWDYRGLYESGPSPVGRYAIADHAADLRRYEGGPEAARRLLKEAGLSLPVPVSLRAMDRARDTNDYAGIVAVQRSLEAAGFAVTLDLVDGSVLKDYLSGTHGGLLYFSRRHARHANYWNVPYDPDNESFEMLAPVRVFSADAVRLHDQLSHTLYPERRAELSRQLQRIWAEQVPVIPMAWGPIGSAHADTLAGWAPDAHGATLWWNAEYWRLSSGEG